MFFIPRQEFLWFFKYRVGKSPLARIIQLKKRSSCKDNREIEQVTIRFRRLFQHQPPVDIIYTRGQADGKGAVCTLKNTLSAVAFAEKVLADFRDDTVTGYGNF